jgi:hypothetical protein
MGKRNVPALDALRGRKSGGVAVELEPGCSVLVANDLDLGERSRTDSTPESFQGGFLRSEPDGEALGGIVRTAGIVLLFGREETAHYPRAPNEDRPEPSYVDRIDPDTEDCQFPDPAYSTVTVFARLRGRSTS